MAASAHTSSIKFSLFFLVISGVLVPGDARALFRHSPIFGLELVRSKSFLSGEEVDSRINTVGYQVMGMKRQLGLGLEVGGVVLSSVDDSQSFSNTAGLQGGVFRYRSRSTLSFSLESQYSSNKSDFSGHSLENRFNTSRRLVVGGRLDPVQVTETDSITQTMSMGAGYRYSRRSNLNSSLTRQQIDTKTVGKLLDNSNEGEVSTSQTIYSLATKNEYYLTQQLALVSDFTLSRSLFSGSLPREGRTQAVNLGTGTSFILTRLLTLDWKIGYFSARSYFGTTLLGITSGIQGSVSFTYKIGPNTQLNAEIGYSDNEVESEVGSNNSFNRVINSFSLAHSFAFGSIELKGGQEEVDAASIIVADEDFSLDLVENYIFSYETRLTRSTQLTFSASQNRLTNLKTYERTVTNSNAYGVFVSPKLPQWATTRYINSQLGYSREIQVVNGEEEQKDSILATLRIGL